MIFPFLGFDIGSLGFSDSCKLSGLFWCERKVTASFSFLLAISLSCPFFAFSHPSKTWWKSSQESFDLFQGTRWGRLPPPGAAVSERGNPEFSWHQSVPVSSSRRVNGPHPPFPKARLWAPNLGCLGFYFFGEGDSCGDPSKPEALSKAGRKSEKRFSWLSCRLRDWAGDPLSGCLGGPPAQAGCRGRRARRVPSRQRFHSLPLGGGQKTCVWLLAITICRRGTQWFPLSKGKRSSALKSCSIKWSGTS